MTVIRNDKISTDGAGVPEPSTTPREERSQGNKLLGAGLGIGAFGMGSGALLGAVCPLCVVAAPALVGAGIYKHLGARRREKRDRAGASGRKPKP